MRNTWIKVHLFIAAFFAPMLLMTAISGGLYLIGEKGSVDKIAIEVESPKALDIKSDTLEADVRELITTNSIDHDFEYLKVSGSTVTTRPTSKVFYQFNLGGDETTVSRNEPDVVYALIELHKGHGPTLYKQLQKVMALGLLVVLLSGLWMGISSPTLRIPAISMFTGGLLVFIVIGLLL